MILHIFNPENDLALASGSPGYTAPASARQMRSELWNLPEWWAEAGDCVWNGVDTPTLKQGDKICPWGWSPALVHQLRVAGVTDEFLPFPDEIAHLRELSHRRTAVQALAKWHEDAPADVPLCGESILCHSSEEVEEAMRRWPRTMLKAPWSSSGKGLMSSDNANAMAWAQRILKAQGSVVAEKMLDGSRDFAMEFHCDGKGGVTYLGLSLFATNERGAYVGNVLAPEEEKSRMLEQDVPRHIQERIRTWWMEYLKAFRYEGPVGVDMMACGDGGICPCIEINWRRTMGLVAIDVYKRTKKMGEFIVSFDGHYHAEVRPQESLAT